MTESVTLVQRVRAALASTTTATLFVDGYDAELAAGAACDEITLTDPGGLPTLLCVSPSLLGAAARRNAAAVLTVPVAPVGAEPAGSAVFVGHLSSVGQRAVAGCGLDVVELTPLQIAIEDVALANDGPHGTQVHARRAAAEEWPKLVDELLRHAVLSQLGAAAAILGASPPIDRCTAEAQAGSGAP